MRLGCNSTVLRLIDSIAIAIAQGYMLARTRLASHPSAVIRAKALADHYEREAQLLERELAVYRAARESIAPEHRWHYTPEHRFEILQIMRLRGWSVVEAARRFVLHPNSVRGWIRALRQDGDQSRLFTGPVWNRIHDAVRWTVHQLRSLAPDVGTGTRTIARLVVRAGIAIHRSSVQRILREESPQRPSTAAPLIPADGCEPTHILAPKAPNRVWHLDLTTLRILWLRFTVAVILDGFSRRVLRLKVYARTPKTIHMVRLVRGAMRSFGTPRFVITDHGGQFAGRFVSALESVGVTVVKGKVRQPSFNGKAERFFRTWRRWLRRALLPLSVAAIQRRLDAYVEWFNQHRPHAALGGRMPMEAWDGVELPPPIPIRQADRCDVQIDITKGTHRGDRSLPIFSIRLTRKEAA